MGWTEEEYEQYKKDHNVKPKATIELIPVEKKKNKYNASRTKFEGTLFDSKREVTTYAELKLLLRSGHITGFCRQAQFILQPGNEDMQPITYKADWIIFYPDGTYKIQDDKGVETETFKLKHKMFKKAFPKLELHVMKGDG